MAFQAGKQLEPQHALQTRCEGYWLLARQRLLPAVDIPIRGIGPSWYNLNVTPRRVPDDRGPSGPARDLAFDFRRESPPGCRPSSTVRMTDSR